MTYRLVSRLYSHFVLLCQVCVSFLFAVSIFTLIQKLQNKLCYKPGLVCICLFIGFCLNHNRCCLHTKEEGKKICLYIELLLFSVTTPYDTTRGRNAAAGTLTSSPWETLNDLKAQSLTSHYAPCPSIGPHHF